MESNWLIPTTVIPGEGRAVVRESSAAQNHPHASRCDCGFIARRDTHEIHDNRLHSGCASVAQISLAVITFREQMGPFGAQRGQGAMCEYAACSPAVSSFSRRLWEARYLIAELSMCRPYHRCVRACRFAAYPCPHLVSLFKRAAAPACCG